MKKIIASLIAALACTFLHAQGGYNISRYDVSVKVNKDASLDVTEDISVHFTESRHGIYRMIPFKYKIEDLPAGTEKADRQFSSGGYSRVFIENIKVPGWKYTTTNENGYKKIKIGNKKKYVDGDQQYTIKYRMLNAINFFENRSELYFNLIGDKWETAIDKVNFKIELYDALQGEPSFFIASGRHGSQQNNTEAAWSGSKILSGNTTKALDSYEGLTVGVKFPKGFLIKQNYQLRGLKWLVMPLIIFALMYFVWKRWGKDEEVTIQTEFYPPSGISPSVAGYIIDDQLNRRDLTALIPYWGAGGYLKIAEKEKDYEFTKLKEIPVNAMNFEKTLFNGIFASGGTVMLSTLKNVLYTRMNSAKAELESQVDKGAYYEKGSRGMGCLLPILGFATLGFGIIYAAKHWSDEPIWFSLAFALSGIIMMVIGYYMPKKTKKGTLLYQKLAGFKEFIQKVEKPRLEVFLKEDPHYFDTVLPYAIVFDVADKWKDKLKDMEVQQPSWYAGRYTGFNTYLFMNSLDRSMNEMSKNFYSTPPKSSGGSSGGSWGGGGFSGGGFGGGGGGSW